jgi:protein-tyrosine-phosphatase
MARGYDGESPACSRKEVYHIDASEARRKGFEDVEAEKFDFVITVCDKAKETCPVWPGQPIIAHWSAPDPALAEGRTNRFTSNSSASRCWSNGASNCYALCHSTKSTDLDCRH